MGQEDFYNKAFRLTPMPTVLIKPEENNFTIFDVNDAFLGLLKIPVNEVMGKKPEVVYSKFPGKNQVDFTGNIMEELQTLSTSKKGEYHGESILYFSGEDIEGKRSVKWECSSIPVIDDKTGNVSVIIQTFQEIENNRFTDPKNGNSASNSSDQNLRAHNIDLLGQITKKNAQFELANQELDDFVYSVSHDLRAPLRRIDGFSQELINDYTDQLDETGAHYLRRIRKGVQDMGNLIDDLLKLSRVSRKKIEIEEVDLSKLVQNIYNDLTEGQNAQNIQLSVQDSLVVTADPGLMKAALTNLISNALKFTSKKDKAVIEIGAKEVEEKKTFYIKDNGVGFDPDHSRKLFQAFHRLHSQKEFDGTGIGLTTVKRIIKLHGGEIWAESRPDKGATFFFKV